jgi:hypothetical protein
VPGKIIQGVRMFSLKRNLIVSVLVLLVLMPAVACNLGVGKFSDEEHGKLSFIYSNDVWYMTRSSK